MVSRSRVAWREGLFLRQQHFQQQDRHLDAAIAAQGRNAGPYRWGVTELVIDRELAGLGKFAIERLRGVMPDGTYFAIPDDLPPPAPMDMPADARDAIVFLTLPANQPGAVAFRNDAHPAAHTTRFVVVEDEVIDTFSEDRSAEAVELARPNLSFGVSRDQTYGRVILGLARVREIVNGAMQFDARYVPPVLDIRASDRVSAMLRDILGRAAQRIDELALRAVEATEGGAETFVNFLLLQTLNRWHAQLAHLTALPMVHPERLYEMLLGMAGEITTLTHVDRRPPTFPSYDHERLADSFEPVVESIQAALSAIFDRAAFQLPLEQAGPGAYTSRITDPAPYVSGFLYIAVSARMPLEDVRTRFPATAKIGPVGKMQQIVESALAGVPLRHVPTAPPQIRTLPGYAYFELDRQSPDFAALATSPALGLHLSGDWPELQIELWCVKRGPRR